MKASRRDRRATLLVAVFVFLVIGFVASPLRRAGAQTTTTAATSSSTSTTSSSSSSSSSSSTSSSSPSSSTSSTTKPSTTTTTTPAQGCHNTFEAGTVHPGEVVRGSLSLRNGCKFTGTVDLTMNDAKLTKSPDANNVVSVSVKINSTTSGVLDDPVPVTLHQGTNTLVVSGQGQTSGGASAGTVTIDASFDLQPSGTTTPVTVVPVAPRTTTSAPLAFTGANLLVMVALALLAIVLGTHFVASRWVAPLDVGAGGSAAIVSLPAFNLDLSDRIRWMLEASALVAVSYILGPPPGRHARKDGPRGLVPMARSLIFRDR